MQRFLHFLACLTIYFNCFGQQYPFIHYTPGDGLISNQIKSIHQDRTGKLYFTSLNGLSVYDGARFSNYNSENGLEHNIVNGMMEMGEDSLWVLTNTNEIYYLKKGRLKKVILNDPEAPIIAHLIRNDQGALYAASEQGLHLFQHNRFIKLPFTDLNGKDINTYVNHLIPAGNNLLVQRDNTLVMDGKYELYLYDTKSNKIIAQTQKERIYAVSKAPDGRIWACTDKAVLALDTAELRKGKIILLELDRKFEKIKNSPNIFIYFDRDGNCWLTDRATALNKVNTNGDVLTYTPASGLNTLDINHIFHDAEGNIWIATLSTGVVKLVHPNISFDNDPFGLSAINNISYSEDNHELLLYSVRDAKCMTLNAENLIEYFHVNNPDLFQKMIETPKGLFGISVKTIYRLTISGMTLTAEPIFTVTGDDVLSSMTVDKNENLLISGRFHLTSIIDGKTVFQKKINSFVDQVAFDTTGNVWVASRGKELIMYHVRPDDPVNYLEQKLIFTKELSGYSPRSLTIDRDNIFWIGTRSHGIYAYQLEDERLTLKYHLTSSSGLTENFVTYLTADQDNHIWACTPSGLDKIIIRNGTPLVENLTKRNNIYQTIHKVVLDKNKTAWALVPDGLMKITSETKKKTTFSPTLMLVSVRSGADTIDENALASLSHKQNNLNFYFAAPTYLDEKHVLFSYMLHGRKKTQWSEPSQSANVSFIGLHPGKYTLDVKASFPAGSYPDQFLQHKFFIMPPWWQTGWFRLIIGFSMIGLIGIVVRYYYRRKLVIQRRVLEKQQAIEKERTRIATDMHDDLGAGLSRIKFLSQSLQIKNMNAETLKNELEKITHYSDDMAEKMGEIVWALNEKNDTLADLVAYIRSYAVEYLANHNIECEANSPMHLPATFIAGEIRRNIFLAVKECMHNIVKHADASHVYLSIELNDKIRIVIQDNGKGIDWKNLRPNGNGLDNIRRRMLEIKGDADFIIEHGTQVMLSVPITL